MAKVTQRGHPPSRRASAYSTLSEDGLGVLHFRFPAVFGDTQLTGLLVGGYLGPLASAFVVTAVADGRPGSPRSRCTSVGSYCRC
ncbi:hypothetical protein [Cryptosporangium sp. NPDC048952]|uniref:hypothetical protein n=1 Tax=Cryptosporangium sp. NPDC048952 TaxID=3363961 RepID=UPI0037193471